MQSKDVRKVFHFDDLQYLLITVNTTLSISVHVSLTVLFVQVLFFFFFGELLTRIIRSLYLDSEARVFRANQLTEAFTVIYNLC